MLDLGGLGAAASGLGSLAGGFLGAKSAKKSTKEAKRQFNIQMNESIQRRVKDAQAAGIHPLFALGASVGASPTMVAGQSDTGSMIGEAIAGAGRAAKSYAEGKGLQRVQEAQIRSAEANADRDEAEAQLARSRAKKLEQEMVSRGHDGFQAFPLGTVEGAALQYGPVEAERPKIKANQPGAPHKTAGVSPAFNEAYVGGGYTITGLDDDKLQGDMVNDAMIAWQLAQAKFRQWRNKVAGIYRVRGPDGRWRSYRMVKSKPGRRGHGARRGRNR